MHARFLATSLCLASSLVAQQKIAGEAPVIPGEAPISTASTVSPNGGGGVIVPIAFRTAFGTSDNAIPWSWTPSHYEQCFLASEFPATQIIKCVGFRGRRTDTGATADAEIWLGYTKYDQTTLTTTYASNFSSGRTQVLTRKKVLVPDMGTVNTDPKFFLFNIPLDQAFVYTGATGNLLIEIKVHGNSNNNANFSYYLNAGSGSSVTTSRIYSSNNANATTGSKTTNYGLAMCFDIKCKVTGIADTFGAGCPGSGGFAGIVVPAHYATNWGESNNYYPHGRSNMRYQQCFDGADVGATAKTINSINFRQDNQTTGRAGGTQNYTIVLGQTTFNHGNIGFDFDKHYDVAGQKKEVLTKTNVNLPTLSGIGANLQEFKVNIPFKSTFLWLPIAGRNLIVEFRNYSTTSVLTYFDTGSNFAACATARVYNASSADATTATSGTRNYGLVMGLGVSGGVGNATPAAEGVTRPIINKSYDVGLSAAAATSAAIMINGISNTKWLGLNLPLPMAFLGAPKCNLLVSVDMMFPTATDATGQATVKLPLPNDQNLVNAKLYQQFFVVDTKTSAGFAMSNGVEASIGEQ